MPRSFYWASEVVVLLHKSTWPLSFVQPRKTRGPSLPFWWLLQAPFDWFQRHLQKWLELARRATSEKGCGIGIVGFVSGVQCQGSSWACNRSQHHVYAGVCFLWSLSGTSKSGSFKGTHRQTWMGKPECPVTAGLHAPYLRVSMLS